MEIIKIMKERNFSITNKTKSTLPRVPFGLIKDTALGKNYCLSLVFIEEKESKKLNSAYRNKNKSTNILSFPLDKKNGEIFITLTVAKKEAPGFNRKLSNFVTFLFIHGLMHLKGMEHGSTMERAEKKLQKKFNV